MRGKIFAALLMLLVVSAFTFYAFAQSKPSEGPNAPNGAFDTQGHPIGPYVDGTGLKAVLCTGPLVVGSDANGSAVRYQPVPNASGKLRIEMQDGSVQVIDLKTVKKMSVSAR